MTQLYAQPYDISAIGFWFETEAEYHQNAKKLRNSAGWPVEEFEIQFNDGTALDAELFAALRIHQGNFPAFLEVAEAWSDEEKIKAIIVAKEVGHAFKLGEDSPDDFDVDLYEMDSLRDLAIEFVEEGLFGEIPAAIQNYLDYDAIARDLGIDYNEITIDGTHYIYRCD